MPGSRITDIFNIRTPVPFLNVDVTRDNHLFIDPSAIRVAAATGDQYAAAAHARIVEVFTEVIACARSSNANDRDRGLLLLQKLNEPNETRLGYSQATPRGNAFGRRTGKQLWDEINANRALDSEVDGPLSIHEVLLSRLERVPLFIPRVGKDRISDISTRMAFDILHYFTQAMVAKYPTLAQEFATHTYPIWDSESRQMIKAELTLPVALGKPLLLVPRNWVYWRLVMDPMAFYNRYATQVIQDEQTTVSSDGRRLRPSKGLLKKQNPEVKVTNTREANRYARDHGRDLTKEYEIEIDETFQPLDGDSAERRL